MEGDNPRTAYASSGHSSSWNPAHRPNSESSIVPSEEHGVNAQDTSQSAAPQPEEKKSRPMSQLQSRSKVPFDSEDDSDDFFDRYGSSTAVPTALQAPASTQPESNAPQASSEEDEDESDDDDYEEDSEDSSEDDSEEDSNEETDVDNSLAALAEEEREHDGAPQEHHELQPPQITRQESINTVLRKLPVEHTLGGLETQDEDDEDTDTEPEPAKAYEHQSANFLDAAVVEDANSPLLQAAGTPGLETPAVDGWGDDGEEFDLGGGQEQGSAEGVDDNAFGGHQVSYEVPEEPEVRNGFFPDESNETAESGAPTFDHEQTNMEPVESGATTFNFENSAPAGQADYHTGEDVTLDWGTTNGEDFDINSGITRAADPTTGVEHKEPPTENGDKALDWGDDDQDFDLGIASTQQNEGEMETIAEVPTDDLAAAWGAALDDEEPLGESAFAFDDEEGFLDENGDPSTAEASEPFFAHLEEPKVSDTKAPAGNKYAPVSAQQPAAPAVQSPYAPASPMFADLPQTQRPGSSRTQTTPAAFGAYAQQPAYAAAYGARPTRPTGLNNAQSFTDKGKSGYASPYDLPEDLAPKRRAAPSVKSPSITAMPPAPPRSSSIGQIARPPQASNLSSASLSPPSSSHSGQAPPNAYGAAPQPAPRPTPKSATSGFFEDLPIVTKPKPASRTSTYTPGPSLAPLPNAQFAPPRSVPPPAQHTPPTQHVNVPQLGAQFQRPEGLPLFPDSVPQHQPVHQAHPPQPTRYSPATTQGLTPAAPPPAVNARYSPAPPSAPSQAGSKYSSAPPHMPPGGPLYRAASSEAVGKPALPFAPRTSSPLAQHSGQPQRQVSAPSALPPVQEVPTGQEEPRGLGLYEPEQQQTEQQNSYGYNLAHQRGTPPPPRSGPPSATTSPQKVRSYHPPPRAMSYQPAPHADQISPPTVDPTFAPPPRARTQSPSQALKHPRLAMQPIIERPASVAAPQSPTLSSATMSIGAALTHRRAVSREIDYIVPQDERASDPMARWRGCPVFHWGPGGQVLTTFPKLTPRYSAGQMAPKMLCSPGEIKVRSVKEVLPLDEKIARFPGPLKGKAKKKEVLAWLKQSIEQMEKSQLETVQQNGKRFEEKILLWKLMNVLVEHDGILEGSPAVDVAVKKLLNPDTAENGDGTAGLVTGMDLVSPNRPRTASSAHSEPVDPKSIAQLRKHLARGERKEAAFFAVDQRLWAHALLISSTLQDKEVWKQVVQEFVRKEVRKSGSDNESLAALYEVFAGNWEESISELVPASTRAGFQMVHVGGADTHKDALAGLDKWKETLSLIISNRTPDDIQAMIQLGNLLAGYGRIEAAHICFLFARVAVHFGGVEEPQANVVLLGADNKAHPFDIARDTESILLTEVYEWALTLAMPTAPLLPYLQSFKLRHAYVLAEHGFKNEAQAYCDSLGAILTAKGQKSPYYNPPLLTHLDTLAQQLSQAPRDTGSGWLSKPTMGKVTSGFTSKFLSFVAGEESEGQNTGSTGTPAGEAGPFGGVQGDSSPTMSRQASEANLYGAYMNGGAVPSIASSATPVGGSRYAPSAYAPRTSLESTRSASAYQPQSYAPSRPSLDSQSSFSGRRQSHEIARPMPAVSRAASSQYTPGAGYNPSTLSSSLPVRSASAYLPAPVQEERPSSSPYEGYQATPFHDQSQSLAPPQDSYEGYKPSTPEPESYGYTPPAPEAEPAEQTQSSYEPSSNSYEPPTGGYQAPESGGYEPPSYTPYEPEPDDDEKPKPKKKSFMDDDDDDFGTAALKKKQKAEADKAADEAFRKAAEADAVKDKGGNGQKKGWFSFGWGSKKADPNMPTVHKAKLGEESSFVYDPDLKKWVNKKAGAAGAAPTSSGTPPPPRGPPSRAASASGSPELLMRPPSAAAGPPRSASGPPMMSPGSRTGTPEPSKTGTESPETAGGAGAMKPPPMPSLGPGPGLSRPPSMAALRGPSSSSGPPSRPGTSMSNASDLDDLLGAAGARKGGTVRKGKRGGRYVDVMAKPS